MGMDNLSQWLRRHGIDDYAADAFARHKIDRVEVLIFCVSSNVCVIVSWIARQCTRAPNGLVIFSWMALIHARPWQILAQLSKDDLRHVIGVVGDAIRVHQALHPRKSSQHGGREVLVPEFTL